jgi:hypothetical protein
LTQRKIWIRTAQIPMPALSGHPAERSNRKVIVQRRADCAFVFPAAMSLSSARSFPSRITSAPMWKSATMASGPAYRQERESRAILDRRKSAGVLQNARGGQQVGLDCQVPGHIQPVLMAASAFHLETKRLSMHLMEAVSA